MAARRRALSCIITWSKSSEAISYEWQRNFCSKSQSTSTSDRQRGAASLGTQRESRDAASQIRSIRKSGVNRINHVAKIVKLPVTRSNPTKISSRPEVI